MSMIFDKIDRGNANFFICAPPKTFFIANGKNISVVDVVIERRSTYLVDVNVAAQRTDPLLFDWGDVLALRRSERNGPRPPSETFELRVVEASDAVRASALSSFRAPLDIAAIADAGGLDELVRRSRLDDSPSSSSSSSYGDVD